MKKTIFVGNGLNNLYNRESWKTLLDKVIVHIGAAGQIIPAEKPFPLLYEEIVAKALKERRSTESDIKDYIAQKMKALEPGKLHGHLADLSDGNIITTNYDQTIEKAIGGSSDQLSNEGFIKESLYSIFRKNVVGKTSVWHAHGDVNAPNSICLGYEQYGGYLQQMRGYAATGTGSSYKARKYLPIAKRLKAGSIAEESWIDLFFTTDVHIFGLSLDFVEYHLWWLLSYRARTMLNNPGLIKSSIWYYYPALDGDKIKGKLDLLSVCGVTSFSIRHIEKNWNDYYVKTMKQIRHEG